MTACKRDRCDREAATDGLCHTHYAKTRRGISEAPVRYRDGAFEYRCEMCGDFWPLDLEFWRPTNGMRRCKACWREYHRIHERERNKDEATRLVKLYKNRLRYAENREARQAANRRWKAANRERIAAYQREYRARRREQAAA